MFTVLTVFALLSLIALNPNVGPIQYATPWFDVPNPTYLLHRRMANSLLVDHSVALVDRVYVRPSTAIVATYNGLFGQDIIYGWTDVECYSTCLQEFNWPFRSIRCVWFHTQKDVTIMVGLSIAFAIAGLLCICWYLDVLYEPLIGGRWASFYLDWLRRCVRQPIHHPSNVRQTFSNAPIVQNNRLVDNHSHPKAARDRTTSSRQMEFICNSLGTTPYYLQQSKSDQRRGLQGCRSYFWAKDMQSEVRLCDPPLDCTKCIVDSDYYLDMPHLLGAYPGHYLISTFQPSAAAHLGTEYNFTFNEDNVVDYRVSGGANYSHQVWNYKSDVIVARARSWTRLWWYLTTYTVDRRRIDDHHAIICLTPVAHIVSPLFPLTWLLPGDVLERLHVAASGYARLDVLTSEGMKRSIARLGTHAVATIPADVGDSLATIARISSVDINLAQVRTTTGITDPVAASVLAEYYRTVEGTPADTVMAPGDSIQRYQYNIADYDVDAKNKLKPFMTPFVPGCYSPDDSLGNDKAAVKGRITDVKAPPDLVITPFIQKCMDEFVEFLVPQEKRHKHYPVDLDEVYDRQSRPAQRQLLAKAETAVGNPSGGPVKTFQKSEAYGKPSEPRIISTINEIDKLHYSAFSYAFNKCLRATAWYAFGKTPLEIALRVAAICLAAIAWILKTDFSRMDGRVSFIFRALERAAMMAWFHKDCHPRLIELMETQQNKRAVTTFGVKYDTGDARLSGSPETADFNSLDNAFDNYMAYRKQGLIPAEAWKKLGLFGGDDGITADLDPKILEKVSTDVGQLVEAEKVSRGESGVQMLSREYGPNVWHGDPSSMCDIKRQLSKFHTTVNLPAKMSPLHKFAVKAYAYYLTDGNTPVIGMLGKLAMELYPELILLPQENPALRASMGTYFAFHPKDKQFPNENYCDWMYGVLERDIPTFDLRRFGRWVNSVRSGEGHILAPPLCADVLSFDIPKQKVEVVVNGEVIASDNPKPPAGVAGAPLSKVKMCNHFLVGKCTYGEKCRFSHG